MDPRGPLRNSIGLLDILLRGRRTDEKRRPGRVNVGALQCDAGDVIDLSCAGARLMVRGGWREGVERRITFTGPHAKVEIEATCVWRRRAGMLRSEVGVRFSEPTPQQRSGLTQLAREHFTGLDERAAA